MQHSPDPTWPAAPTVEDWERRCRQAETERDQLQAQLDAVAQESSVAPVLRFRAARIQALAADVLRLERALLNRALQLNEHHE